jgi:uncharacterized protein DUF6702
MINFFLVVITLMSSLLHPFHVSVCDIEFNEKIKSIQVSQRLFMDDFELALSKRFGINLMIDDNSASQYRDSLIQVYLVENLKLKINGKDWKHVYIGNEIEEDGMWCYIEYEGVKKLNTLEVTSTILLDSFEDQANIIHFSYGDYTKSIKLDRLKKTGTFSVGD